MKYLPAVLLFAVTIPATFAQHPARRGKPVTAWQPTGKQVGSVQFSSRKMVKHSAALVPHAISPATGVVQVHYEEGQTFAYFVATAPIPAAAQEQVTISVDDGNGNPTSITFDPVSYE